MIEISSVLVLMDSLVEALRELSCVVVKAVVASASVVIAASE